MSFVKTKFSSFQNLNIITVKKFFGNKNYENKLCYIAEKLTFLQEIFSKVLSML